MEGRDGKGGGGRRERETGEPGIDDLAVHQRSVGRGSKRVRKFKPRRREALDFDFVFSFQPPSSFPLS
jgi:hypothetical protein